MNQTAKFLMAIAAAAALQGAGLTLASTPVPSGKWSFTFTDARGQPERPIRVYTYRPRACDSTCPIQFVMHGVERNAAAYRDYWELAADRYHFLVVAPEFSERYWPKAAAYSLGDLANQDNREKWTFSAIEHLFDEVRDGQKGYAIFGHSAGGQFVERMALFRPDNRATVMVAANPGWYTLPEWRPDKAADSFPYSLARSRAGEAQLRQALAKHFVLMLGERDTDPDAKNLNKSPGAMRQGASRFERGENFYKAVTAAAQVLGVKLAWELVEVPNVAHDGAAMSRAAADAIYAKR